MYSKIFWISNLIKFGNLSKLLSNIFLKLTIWIQSDSLFFLILRVYFGIKCLQNWWCSWIFPSFLASWLSNCWNQPSHEEYHLENRKQLNFKELVLKRRQTWIQWFRFFTFFNKYIKTEFDFILNFLQNEIRAKSAPHSKMIIKSAAKSAKSTKSAPP